MTADLKLIIEPDQTPNEQFIKNSELLYYIGHEDKFENEINQIIK